jgi:hypothetical protein
VEESIREYCKRAKARFDRCTTFDMTRQFLLDHVERIVYLREKVTILGSVPVKRHPSEEPVPLPFRIDGELDRKGIDPVRGAPGSRSAIQQASPCSGSAVRIGTDEPQEARVG